LLVLVKKTYWGSLLIANIYSVAPTSSREVTFSGRRR